jgi:glutamine synthetase type III
MELSTDRVIELLVALSAGGVLTAVITYFSTRSKSDAEARKTHIDGEVSLMEIALRMTDKFETTVKSLEEKTKKLEDKNLQLETELGQIRLTNLTTVRELEKLKIQNDELEKTCTVLLRENTNLKLELENCIKKEF